MQPEAKQGLSLATEIRSVSAEIWSMKCPPKSETYYSAVITALKWSKLDLWKNKPPQ